MSFLATNVTVFVLNCCFIFNFRLIKKIDVALELVNETLGLVNRLPWTRLLNSMQFSILASSSVLPGHYIDAVENQMKTIPCGSDAVDSNAKITWMRNGVEATKNPRFTLDTATGALVVNRADRNDSGSYNCSIMKIVKGRFTVVGYEMYFNVQCMYIFLLKSPVHVV